MSLDERRLAVLVSGTGRHLANLVERTRGGELDARVALVIADRDGIRGLRIAEEAAVPTRVIRPSGAGSPEAFSAAVFHEIETLDCGTVVMAGFLRLLPIPSPWLGRVLNVHPSLLPKHGGQGLYGERVHRAVLEAGDRVSGCTVHYVDDQYDHGPPIVQREVPVLASDTPETLAARVFEAELEALPEALRRHLSGDTGPERAQVQGGAR